MGVSNVAPLDTRGGAQQTHRWVFSFRIEPKEYHLIVSYGSELYPV